MCRLDGMVHLEIEEEALAPAIICKHFGHKRAHRMLYQLTRIGKIDINSHTFRYL